MSNIIPYEKKILAKMSGADLARTVNTAVGKVVRACEEKVENEFGYLVPTSAARDAWKRLAEYIEEQQALFASKGLDPDRAGDEAIVPTGEILPNGNEVFRIVKRNCTIRPMEGDIIDDESERLEAVWNRTDLDGARVLKQGKPDCAKYGDAERLMFTDETSPEIGEVDSYKRDFNNSQWDD